MGMRILIVRLGAIGDVIHTLPSLSAIRAGMGDCSVGWVVQKGVVYSLLEDCTDIQELYGVDLSSPSGITDAVRTIRNAAFDLSLDFQGLLKSAMIPWLARIPRRVVSASRPCASLRPACY
jgi:ADP-heptose:LPS heptosyltransferase